MKKTLAVILLALAMMWLLAPLCFAEEAAAATAGKTSNILYYALAALGCGLGIGLAALGTGIGQGIGLGVLAKVLQEIRVHQVRSPQPLSSVLP